MKWPRVGDFGWPSGRNKNTPVVAIFDGDQTTKHQQNLQHAKNMTENPGNDFEQWFNYRCLFLPGDNWPECWIVQKAKVCAASLAAKFQIEVPEFNSILDQGLSAGRHSEFYRISALLGMQEDRCLDIFTQVVVEENRSDFSEIHRRLDWLLSNEDFSMI